MDNSSEFPTDRDGASTTPSAADLIDGLALPIVTPISVFISSLEGLPALPLPGSFAKSATETTPEPQSQLEHVRALMDSCGDTVAALRRHQNQCAARVAVMIERLDSAARFEGTLLSLDWWQKGCIRDQITAELAVVLHAPEGSTGRLIDQSLTLVRDLPASFAVLEAGELNWDHAVVIAEETSLLRQADVPPQAIALFEQRLLEHAANKTLPSFRSTARRLRERSYPETIVAKTKRAYADRSIRVSRGADGMSWFTLYGPSPTIEAIWDQCTYTAQAARGDHEDRTMAQLRADIAAALLLRQSMDQNGIHRPAPASTDCFQGTFDGVGNNEPNGTAGTTEDIHTDNNHPGVNTSNGSSSSNSTGSSSSFNSSSTSDSASSSSSSSSTMEGTCGSEGDNDTADTSASHAGGLTPWHLRTEPDPCGEGAFPDPQRDPNLFQPWQVPLFEDPDYSDPAFRDPDPRNLPEWLSPARPPLLSLAGPAGQTGTSKQPCGTGSTPDGSDREEAWPPLPQVTPVVLIPGLSLLGATNEPAWMEGVGPMSMDVAKRLTVQAGSFLRVLVDPITNKPLDIAPERYRINKAMRTMLLIRDEYCEFPGCLAKAVNCEVDHVKSFETGGRSIYNNLEHLCAHHHLVKHFKDDKDRHGRKRCIADPERQSLRLRGWSPLVEADGRISWTSPSGRYCPPELTDKQPPVYPKWLKKQIQQSLKEGSSPGQNDPDLLLKVGSNPTLEATAAADDLDWLRDPTRGIEETWDAEPSWEENADYWDGDNVPEPPPGMPFDDQQDELLTRLAMQQGLSDARLGLAA